MRLLALLSAIVGCSAEPAELRVAANPDVPTAWTVRWEAEGAERTWVEYGLDPAALERASPDAAQPRHTLLGLTAGHTWYAQGVSVDGSGAEVRTAVAELVVAAPPVGLPEWTVDVVDPDAIDPDALVFVSLMQDPGAWLVGLTREGEYAWWYRSEGDISIPSAHPGADGRSFVFTHHSEQEGKPRPGLLRLSLDGTEAALTPGNGHHDVIQLPDGRIAWIRNENPSAVTLDDGTVEDLSVDTLVVNEEGAPEAEAQVVFSFLDDYGHPPYRTCSHFDGEGQGPGKDYTHANSILYDAASDALLVMSKNLDALVSVDLASGAVNWQAGGRWGDVVDLDGDVVPADDHAWYVEGPNRTWWSHGHMSHFWGTGFLVFDNGYHHPEVVSRVVEYAFDADARTLRKVGSIDDEDGAFNPLLGDARRLRSGNTLVSWSLSGKLTEHTPDGAVAWRASASLGTATGRVTYVPDVYDLHAE